MDKQQVYDNIVEHFSKPGAVFGYDDGPGCCYREDGNRLSNVRCAFGVQIPNELYDPSMEFKLASTVVEEYHLYQALDFELDGTVMEFIQMTQNLHDNMAQGYSPNWSERGVIGTAKRVEWTPQQFLQVLAVLVEQEGLKP